MSDRSTVLRAVRAGVAGQVERPAPFRSQETPASWERFAERLRSVGGEPLGPHARAERDDVLARSVQARAGEGRVVISGPAVRVVGPGPWERLPDDADPHTLADVELAVLLGTIGVEENGAVAVPGDHAPVRALPFLCQHLVLLLDVAALVSDMHAAIRAMPPDATAHHHFTWISGPSKTADIELALVMGAHGPRTLAVLGMTP